MTKRKTKTKSATERIKSAASKSLQDGGCVARPKQARAKKITERRISAVPSLGEDNRVVGIVSRATRP